jgi:hypothetical protein
MEADMASNGSRGKGRIGAVTGRSQTRNPKTGLWTKRSAVTGKFMDVKQSGGAFKGVRREG